MNQLLISSNLILPILISFAIALASGPIIIPFLRRLKIGQTVRAEGPESHLQKTGTPTMGGLIILLSLTVTSLFYVKEYPAILPILLVTLGFGIIGFVDDYIKVVLKRSLGLRAWQKMLGQIVVTGTFAYYMKVESVAGLTMKIPFINHNLDLSIFSIPFLFIVVLGTVNGTNFTDGLDGLATKVTILVAGFFMLAASYYQGNIEPVAGAMVGALLGFLVFNSHPAKVFMGDTGSLAIGGFVAASAYMLNLPIFILIVGFIYVAEVLSVMLQVSYFKITKGKRIFKMAPIHHHFELCGWKETKVVSIFTIITAVLCLVALLAM